AGAVAQGDLTVRIEATTKDETGTLLASLKSMNENLHRIVTQVRQGTDAITTASKESPAATWTCPRAPKSRPARWKKPPRPW
ncbi:methyl-accepting chemotaxis protein, partial [Acinetobacter baumannii]